MSVHVRCRISCLAAIFFLLSLASRTLTAAGDAPQLNDVAVMEEVSTRPPGLASVSSSSDESAAKVEAQAPVEMKPIDTEESPETGDNVASPPAPTEDGRIQLQEKALQDAHKASSAFTGIAEEDAEVSLCCTFFMCILKIVNEKTKFRANGLWAIFFSLITYQRFNVDMVIDSRRSPLPLLWLWETDHQSPWAHF